MDAPVVILGGAVLDLHVRPALLEWKRPCALSCRALGAYKAFVLQARPFAGHPLNAGGTVPGTVTQVPGGVARNIAECMARIGRSANQHDACRFRHVLVYSKHEHQCIVHVHVDTLCHVVTA